MHSNLLMVILFLFLSYISSISAQSITDAVPDKVDRTRPYLIYLHGGIVQDMGVDAVSEDFGSYEYYKILEAFRVKGFNVISQVRPKGTEITAYANVLAEQIRLIKKRGIKDKNIIVVGASLGAYMSLEAAKALGRSKIRYVLIGLCSEYAIDRYSKYKGKLIGNFLSIYEQSDQKGSCQTIFEPSNRSVKFKEIRTNTGRGHGFLFKPDEEWVTPLFDWIATPTKK